MTNVSLLILTLAIVLVAVVAREVVMFHRWLVRLRRIRTLHGLDLGRRKPIVCCIGEAGVPGTSSPRAFHAPESPTRLAGPAGLPRSMRATNLRHGGTRLQAVHADRR